MSVTDNHLVKEHIVQDRSMQLAQLLNGFEYTITDCDNTALQDVSAIQITGIVNDSRKITPGCLFLCIKGAAYDSHQDAAKAVEQGAAAVVVMQETDLPADGKTVIIHVQDTRIAMAHISAAWFGYPATKMKVIGLTGTKGKTTTTYLIRSMLMNAGYKVGLIGTIEYIVGDEHIHANNTTPESYTLQSLFARMVECGTQIVVMEVSSQALKLHRTAGIEFDIGVFTNLERDHIGGAEHKDMEEYIYCKSLLFKQCKTGFVNMDDVHMDQVTAGHTCDIVTYGFDDRADLRALNIAYIRKPGALGVFFDTKGLADLHAEIANPGRFSVYNALCAIGCAHLLGIDNETIVTSLKEMHVRGRIEMVPVSDRYTLIIDYAHNAMALKSLLTTLRDYRPSRLVCLFGCGGNRARDRRTEMGEVSGRYADFTIITSDNPRDEDPQAIIDDIKQGIEQTEGVYVEIPDRKEAIAYAIQNAQSGDIIVLAGKGHEDYQEIKGVKYPMDERDLIHDILTEMKMNGNE